MLGLSISKKKQKILVSFAIIIMVGGIAVEWLLGHDLIQIDIPSGTVFGLTILTGLIIICCISSMLTGSYAAKMPEYGEMETKFNEGMALYEEGEYEEAIQIFKELMGSELNHKRALYYTAEAYEHLDEHEQVKKYITKYLEMQPNDQEAWGMLGDAHKKLFEYEEAEEAYSKGKKLS
ncbi:tetratricopeptide repeat protein [Candidatus Thorarchaeota archaeon]|nr:MAG: tetratricopeptide repeat protein [Candidatus Thorarchaeota archaeon]